MKKCDGKSCSDALRTVFVIIGVVVSLAALAAVVYTLFKKYFEVSFECDGECGDCDECFAEGEEESFEPICCCEEDEEAVSADPDADDDSEEADESAEAE